MTLLCVEMGLMSPHEGQVTEELPFSPVDYIFIF